MATTSVPITAGTGTPIRVVTNPGVDSGADQQIVTLADSAGNLLGTNAAPLPAYDPDSSTSGSMTATDAVVAVPAGAGAILTGTPTAGSTVSWALTGGDATIDLQLTGTFGSGTVWLEASADGGTSWVPLHLKQVGVLQTTIMFGATAAGVYRAAAAGWSNIRTRITGATSPSVAVTMRAGAGEAVLILGASLPAGSNTLGTVLIGANNQAIGTVTLGPGGNVIGGVGIGGITQSAFSTTSAASTNATSVKNAAGNLYEVTVSNPTATAAYFKLYNLAAAPTVGTSVPVATYRVAATGSAGDTVALQFGANGKRFTTGIAWAITAAAAATDTAATVAGIQVHGTYI